MRKKGLFSGKKRKPASAEMALQITSMADIFTIILVFLLKSLASGASSISPTVEMNLPDGKNQGVMKDTLKIELARDSLLVDAKEVMKLQNYRFRSGDVLDSGQTNELAKVFATERANQPLPATVSQVLVLADQHAPYSTLRAVMASAASAGFVDLQLVIVEREE